MLARHLRVLLPPLCLCLTVVAPAVEPEKAAGSMVASAAPPSGTDSTRVSRGLPDGKEPSDFLLRLGGFLGNGNSSAGRTIAIGATMEIQAERYYGMDLHVHYGMAVESKGGVAGKSDQSGGLFNLKVQYPFSILGVRLTPKFGLGLGTYNGGTESYTGQFAVVGVEAEAGRFLLRAEAYRGIGGSVTMTDTAATDWSHPGTAFRQYRAAALYRFAPHARAGIELVKSRWLAVERDQFLLPVQFDF